MLPGSQTDDHDMHIDGRVACPRSNDEIRNRLNGHAQE
jgi:hypothetical protein